MKHISKMIRFMYEENNSYLHKGIHSYHRNSHDNYALVLVPN